MDAKGRKDFWTLHKQGVVSQEAPFSAITIYADLQNPLLTKYQFDAQDFMVGAKEAFKQVHMTIASADFFNYSNGFGKHLFLLLLPSAFPMHTAHKLTSTH